MRRVTAENSALQLSCPRVLGELFMKVLTEEEQVQQGASLWGATTADSQVGGSGSVSRPLDFNDGPAVSLCGPTAPAFLLHQLKKAVACTSVISAAALRPAYLFPSRHALSPRRLHSHFRLGECLPTVPYPSPSARSHLVLIQPRLECVYF